MGDKYSKASGHEKSIKRTETTNNIMKYVGQAAKKKEEKKPPADVKVDAAAVAAEKAKADAEYKANQEKLKKEQEKKGKKLSAIDIAMGKR